MAQNNSKLVGIDEAGRGAWAGPLVAGAAVLKHDIAGLTDSKKLTPIQRQKLTLELKQQALSIGIGWVSPQEIDIIGLTKATTLAMSRALKQIDVEFNDVLIDGNIQYIEGEQVRTMIKADLKSQAVAAASVIAKVARDQYMSAISQNYSDFSFDKHVGYGVKQHSLELEAHGVTDIHRLSYKPVAKINEVRTES